MGSFHSFLFLSCVCIFSPLEDPAVVNAAVEAKMQNVMVGDRLRQILQ